MNIICYGAGKNDMPENTILAIKKCTQLNTNWIVHIDLQLTKDGEVVLFKDDNTARICDKKFVIEETNYSDLKALDAAYHFQKSNHFPFKNKAIKIPTLKEVFKLFPKTKFILDIHSQNLAIVDKMIALVKKFNVSSNVILTSKVDSVITAFRNKEPNWSFAANTVRARKIVYSNMFYLDNIIPVDAHLMIIPACDKDSLFLRERIIDYCTQQGKKTWTWIFDGPKNDLNSVSNQIISLEKQGLNGVITSSPLKIQNALIATNSLDLGAANKIAS